MTGSKRFLALAGALALAACGGSSSGGSTPTPTTYTISGTITGATSVTVTLGGASTATTTTDAGGNYAFAGLANGTYTVKPSKGGFAFNPIQTTVVVNGANVTGTNFVATAAASTWSVSGQISGDTLGGVLISITGSTTGATTSDLTGGYTLSGVPDGASITITPTKAGYTFTPASVTVTVSANVTRNFTATAIPYTISGTVSGGATAVTVTLSGDQSLVATTDPVGAYSFSVTAGSYTVTPSKAGYAFTPASRAVAVTNASLVGQDFAASASTTYAITGTITGPVALPATITVTLGGGATRTTTTDQSGIYSFTGLANESYTVTPSFPPSSGWGFSPSSATVTMAGASKTQNFSFVSAVPSYQITGTVSYAGTKTGRVYLNAYYSNCTGCSAAAGTSIGAPSSFVLQGLSPGSYVISARLDSGGHGVQNAGDPTGTSGTVTITNADATGVTLTLTDPSTPAATTPTNLAATPGSGATVIFWDAPADGNGIETATSYDISWGTDAAATSGGVITGIAARDDTHYVHSGLSNGTASYYKIRSNVGASASAWSAVTGPVTAGGITGTGYTVSGTVSVGAATTGPLIVILVDEQNGVFRLQRFASPAFPQAYSISGVPPGLYFVGAIVDSNSNNVVDEGDVSNVKGNGPQPPIVTVTAADVSNASITLTTARSNLQTTTEHTLPVSGPEFYQVSHNISDGVRRVVRATVVYGPGLPLPLSIGNSWGSWQSWNYLGTTAPAVGTAYKFYVYYDDGTSDLLATSSITGVLMSFAQNLTETTTGGGSRGAPIFGWSAPSAPPASYGYQVGISGGNASWWYPDGPPLPSSTTSVRYNVDGRATPATLANGTPYTWSVTVVDADGNRARREKSYTP